MAWVWLCAWLGFRMWESCQISGRCFFVSFLGFTHAAVLLWTRSLLRKVKKTCKGVWNDFYRVGNRRLQKQASNSRQTTRRKGPFGLTHTYVYTRTKKTPLDHACCTAELFRKNATRGAVKLQSLGRMNSRRMVCSCAPHVRSCRSLVRCAFLRF